MLVVFCYTCIPIITLPFSDISSRLPTLQTQLSGIPTMKTLSGPSSILSTPFAKL